MSILWAVTDSKSFRDCVHDRKEYQPYHYLHAESSFFIKMITRAKLHSSCAFVAIRENGEAVTAISTIAIAGFTGTLWWVTWGMVRIARDQQSDIKEFYYDCPHLRGGCQTECGFSY